MPIFVTFIFKNSDSFVELKIKTKDCDSLTSIFNSSVISDVLPFKLHFKVEAESVLLVTVNAIKYLPIYRESSLALGKYLIWAGVFKVFVTE